MLRVEGLQSGYGSSQVLFGMELDVGEGEVVSLMGRNGMGKTTTVRTIMGMLKPTAGTVTFAGEDITGTTPERVARLGAGLVPEGRRVFHTLTVRENLVATGANRRNEPNPWNLSRIYELFPRLGDRASQSAGTLSGGEQQMLAIGRALMTNPRLLILDEATEGLAPVIRAEIWGCLGRLKDEGHAILVIDKNIKELRRLARRYFIVEKGRVVWSGDAAALDDDAKEVSGYVGI